MKTATGILNRGVFAAVNDGDAKRLFFLFSFFRCCYKLVKEKFKWFGIQTRVENLIMTQEERLFRNFHRQLFCWTDEWYGLTMQDIRALEAAAVEELNKERKEGSKKGFTTED